MRLTNHDPGYQPYVISANKPTWRAIYDKLCEYEDAEEQGRLVILPCKVGDTLYAPTRNFISEFRVSQFDFGGYDEIGRYKFCPICGKEVKARNERASNQL